MAFASSQQLNKYYDLYKDIDVTFSKEVIMALNLDPRQAFVRCSGGQWPCIINSASMTKAKIICGKKSGFIEKLKEGVTALSVRFMFFAPEIKDTLSFFVSAKLIGISAYETGSHDLILISLEYTQRAPDDLIEKLGILLEANINSKKRLNDRITVTAETARKIGLVQKETVAFVDGIPRRCILSDISFSGAKIIIAGIANFLINKDVTVRFTFEDPPSVFGIKGKSLRAEHVEGRKDFVAIAIHYYEDTIPMLYKMYLNRYFSAARKTQSEKDGEYTADAVQDVQ